MSLTTSYVDKRSKIEVRVYVDLRQIGASRVVDTKSDATRKYTFVLFGMQMACEDVFIVCFAFIVLDLV